MGRELRVIDVETITMSDTAEPFDAEPFDAEPFDDGLPRAPVPLGEEDRAPVEPVG